ncbi:MAG: SDR family NAD(P)-dependent oxidoreductase, partial [Burkholderiales bacterium]
MPLNPPISDWSGQRVWIIGASSGIGEATARAMLALGAKVALSARTRAPLEVLAQPQPDRAHVLPLDITAVEQVRTALAEIEGKWNGIDLAVIMAGTH